MFPRRVFLPVLILCIVIAGYIYLKNGVKAATVITVASKDFTENILDRKSTRLNSSHGS